MLKHIYKLVCILEHVTDEHLEAGKKGKEKENRFFSLIVYVSFIPSGDKITKARNQRELLIRKYGCAADRWIGKTLRSIWKENLLLQLLQRIREGTEPLNNEQKHAGCKQEVERRLGSKFNLVQQFRTRPLRIKVQSAHFQKE